ncbi:type II toxin-antitoxin system VapC family toxin [Bryobacter aggregatus]|uniref:type II toxin-antitoxin system VapC family toxin n=1 Tax=Bryobacter aggregatus TaxID=360054 RepID=UPI0004E12F69|nr:PIN domain-containing protein [Bryobacter aggregatus]
MSTVYLDTHVAIWMHDGLLTKLTQAAIAAIEESPLLLSPMAYLEFDSLHKRNRIRFPASTIYANLNTSFAVTLCTRPFAAVAAAATEFTWTSDPFDRIIVAQSITNPGSRLITADETIRAHYDRAVW